MTKFKNIEALGLKVHTLSSGFSLEPFVFAADLEAELAKGVEVFGVKFDKELDANSVAFALYDDMDSTHSGLLIDYKPIPKHKPVSKEEIREYLEKNNQWSGTAFDLLKRILDAGVE